MQPPHRAERRGETRRVPRSGVSPSGAGRASTQIFWGAAPTPAPGTTQRPSSQACLQLLGAERQDPALQTPGFTHQTKFASWANLTCFLAQIRSKHFLRYFIVLLFFKMGRGDPAVPRASLPLARKLVRLLPREEGRGVPGKPSTPFILPSPTPSGSLPLRGCPTAAGTTGDLPLGSRSPLCWGRTDTHRSPILEYLGMYTARNRTGFGTPLLAAS